MKGLCFQFKITCSKESGCCITFPKDVKYNSLASRTHSVRLNSSIYRNSLRDSCHLKNSSSQELFLRPLCRTERAASEYNERIKRSPTNGATNNATTNKLSPMALTPSSLPQSSLTNRKDFLSNASTRSFSPSLLEKRSNGKQITKPCQKKSYRQQSQPIPAENPTKSLNIVDQRRMSDNPQTLSRSATPVSILTLKNSSIERKNTMDSNYSSTSAATESSVPSVIVTLLKDDVKIMESAN
uniref:Uncharacterized protein n=1 Tax=Panagrolaimus davidi TaxID=227884 RepID=A0A914P816_9BILA